jgi:asparagine synthetase B (glutamine-hydrolysing)
VCGIAGIISLNSDPRIEEMLQAVEHRGRDDQGVWISEADRPAQRRVCLGHRRLSIIDTSPRGS